ncbi:nitrilase family protein [Lignipirellula cremea]|uniref:(R)-stereoselective amidase n=1 Tax=Lignipirellula cremea TaxID=2528010 RepID=A0A518DPI8_9BACT|nr:nitrilase family protein [Lignipirellula cremea]QDU93760.1 (R)-stereoselective amidase [Lignipirellula cremea]
MQDLTAGVVQFQHAPGDKRANLDVIQHFVEQASRQQVELLLFPECCISGYWHLRKLSRAELLELAEPVEDGPSSQRLGELARQHQMTISAGLVELAPDGRMFNTQVVAMPDGRFARHRKLHCFISEHLSSGDDFTVFTLPTGQQVGVLTCYDNNLVENVRITALKGAEILLAPHQTGGCDTGSPHAMGVVDRRLWDNRETDPLALEAELLGDKGRGWLLRWLPARAHDNGLFLLFANGIGPDDNEVRTGNAMILDPYGRMLVETGKAGDDLVVATLSGALRERLTGTRWIRSRRPELYHPLTVATGQERDTRTLRFDHLAENGANAPVPGRTSHDE